MQHAARLHSLLHSEVRICALPAALCLTSPWLQIQRFPLRVSHADILVCPCSSTGDWRACVRDGHAREQCRTRAARTTSSTTCSRPQTLRAAQERPPADVRVTEALLARFDQVHVVRGCYGRTSGRLQCARDAVQRHRSWIMLPHGKASQPKKGKTGTQEPPLLY